jgi:hypothetical protein
MAAFHASGLISGLLLGDAASIRFDITNVMRSVSDQSIGTSRTSPSPSSLVARYACTRRCSSGFRVQAGSVNRRSPRAEATVDVPTAIRPNSAASVPSRAATCRGLRARPAAKRRPLRPGSSRWVRPADAWVSNWSSGPAASGAVTAHHPAAGSPV